MYFNLNLNKRAFPVQLHFLQHLVLVQPALVHKELQQAGLTSEDGSIRCSVESCMDATLNVAFGG